MLDYPARQPFAPREPRGQATKRQLDVCTQRCAIDQPVGPRFQHHDRCTLGTHSLDNKLHRTVQHTIQVESEGKLGRDAIERLHTVTLLGQIRHRLC